MRYDRNGFPIPVEFDRPPTAARDAADFGRVGPRPATLDRDGGSERPGGLSGFDRIDSGRFGTDSGGRRRPGVWKRWLLIAVIFGGVVPAVVVPQVLPLVREAVVLWSLQRAAECEAQSEIGRASCRERV